MNPACRRSRLPCGDRRVSGGSCRRAQASAFHLIRRLDEGGEPSAAALSAEMGGGMSEPARALAYRLYSICDRKGWAELARDYNNLAVSWQAIRDQAATVATEDPQGRLIEE